MDKSVVYIKEAWASEKQYDHLKPREIPHTAKIFYLLDGYDQATMGKKRSPLFMPAWAARYFIQITDVRAERLQEITEIDALNEGAEAWYKTAPNTDGAGYIWDSKGHVMGFARLWDTINKPPYDWQSNPWVWRYEFKVSKNKLSREQQRRLHGD